MPYAVKPPNTNTTCHEARVQKSLYTRDVRKTVHRHFEPKRQSLYHRHTKTATIPVDFILHRLQHVVGVHHLFVGARISCKT